MYYNSARIHQTLRITPEMAAGFTDKIADIVKLVEGRHKAIDNDVGEWKMGAESVG